MSTLEIKIDIESAIQAMEKAPEVITRALDIGFRKSSLIIERQAKFFSPVDTGRMRASIAGELYPLRTVVQPHTDYAIYVERRTPFMSAAAIEVKPEIEKIFEEEIDTALKSI